MGSGPSELDGFRGSGPLCRFGTSQGLLCNLSGVPGTYEKHVVFTVLGRRVPSRGVLLALFAAPG